jgi:predicted helicase
VDSTKRIRRSTKHITAIFEVASAGLQTKQDEWAYGRESVDVLTKMQTLIATYEAIRLGAPKPMGVGNIKWHRELDRRLKAGTALVFDGSKVVESAYRAFTSRYLYFDAEINSQSFRLHELFTGSKNPTIVFSDPSFRTSFSTLATNLIPEHHFLASKDSFQAVPRYRYTKSGDRLDNITDWAHQKLPRIMPVNALPRMQSFNMSMPSYMIPSILIPTR